MAGFIFFLFPDIQNDGILLLLHHLLRFILRDLLIRILFHVLPSASCQYCYHYQNHRKYAFHILSVPFNRHFYRAASLFHRSALPERAPSADTLVILCKTSAYRDRPCHFHAQFLPCKVDGSQNSQI